MKKLSIVVPIFNEEENIQTLYDKLTSVATKLKHFDDYEIVTVNDGSRDGSLKKLQEIASTDHHLKIVSFTRNFGQEPATVAGVDYASGDAVAIIDADLQDPPELFLEFEQELHNGVDIAYGQRSHRLNEPWLKKITSKLFYPTFRWFTKLDVPCDTGNCCMMSRRAADGFRNLKEHSPFIRGMIYWSGYKKKAVLFVRQKRAAGTTKYNYWKLTTYAMDNIISFSTTPLYLIVFASVITGGISALWLFGSLLTSLFGFSSFSGMNLLIICSLIFFSMMLFCLGLIGLYIGKIFEEAKARPRYIVETLVNLDTTKL